MSEGVVVVGGGVIGSLYAAHLARLAEVWVLTRRPEHAAALEAHGLRVSGKSDFTAELRATADESELPDADLVILSTKATDVDDAAARLAGRVPSATVMTIQNGLGAEEIVRIVPQYRGFDYLLVEDEIVIVDPSTLEIVAVIPA